ncbi:uncharacterized protein LOC112268307 isoform X2 [Homo sapiens]|uniref:uncharacterized protein LOC112268307 isoform X2 n=1 Tax=Homo sapiens TaxID=9606 RepID=UPI0005CFF3C5|nr:uncharacterized protein LOC112268307 isoform X2 [Homo sapiens]XP_047303072.1 uncharacterized protein LOC112268307 isoform X2 [Homo sapiens]
MGLAGSVSVFTHSHFCGRCAFAECSLLLLGPDSLEKIQLLNCSHVAHSLRCSSLNHPAAEKRNQMRNYSRVYYHLYLFIASTSKAPQDLPQPPCHTDTPRNQAACAAMPAVPLLPSSSSTASAEAFSSPCTTPFLNPSMRADQVETTTGAEWQQRWRNVMHAESEMASISAHLFMCLFSICYIFFSEMFMSFAYF